jgi:NitT/TauT family transport system ATP-binding protein
MNLELLRIWSAVSRRTAIFVTHSIREAIFLSDSVAVLSPNPGRLLGVHRVKLPRPRQLKMRDSKEFREMNFAIEESIEKAILQN